MNPRQSSLSAISPATLRGTDDTRGLEGKLAWLSTRFQADAPPHPSLSACPCSLRPLSPSRWPLRTGSSNKSPGRLDAARRTHVLRIDYRLSDMMHREASVRCLLGGLSSQHTMPLESFSYSRPAPLQLIPCRTVKREFNLKGEKNKIKQRNWKEQAFLVRGFLFALIQGATVCAAPAVA